MGDDVALGDENIPPIQDELFRLYSQGFVTDITLTCEDGKIFEAHKVILSARSNYFYNLIPKLKGDPVIFLKGVKGTYLEKILKYVYSGTAIVPRTQLRSLFDVARSLQIKGLTELSQGELGKNLPGSSCAKSMTMSPGGTKPDSETFRYSQATREAREIALKQQQKLYDKFSTNSFKNKSNVKGSQTETGKSPSKKMKGTSKEVENHDEESFTFKYKHISDDSDDVDNDDANDSDFEVQNKPVQAAKKYSKKKRSKPGKSELKSDRKMSKSSTDGETDSSDETNDEPSKRDYFSNSSESDSDSENSDIETGDSESETKSHGRTKKEYSKLKKEPSPSLDDYYDAPAKRPYRRPQKGPAVNGQQILTVQCKGKRAELHLPRFCNGSKGKSVLYKNQWLTPDDYEKACGSKSKKYLDTITTDYGPLKTLTISGLLKPHAKKCKCNVCNDEEPEAPKSTKKGKAHESTEVTQDKLSENIPDERESLEESKNISKRKKSDIGETNKKAKIGLEETLVTDSSSAMTLKEEVKTIEADQVFVEEKGKLTIQLNSPVKSQNFKSGEIISPPTLTTTKPTTSVPATSVMTNISTFSPSSTDSLSPTFISLSTAPQISPKTSSLGSSMIPFPSKLSGIPSPSSASITAQKSVVQSGPSHPSYSTPPSSLQTSPALSHAKFETKPQVHSQQTKPQIAIQMGPPKLDSASIMASSLQMTQAQHQGSFQMQRSRLGAVMQVRCKAVSAYLYTNKYESGSKGKCIMLGEEWLTPNEFEERSGSKAKKYLSSIKCLGRPLRAYVNSGELRGSGPPPSPKPPRMTKPKPPQAIAPAPGPGHSHGQLNMSQINMSNPGMSSGHLAQSYTPVAMMGGVSVAGQPILINQSSFSVANSMANSGMNQSNLGATPILAPMTFTLAPMSGMDQRQGMGVQQMHNSHHM